MGIITDPSVAGLPHGPSWNISQGGSGFAPPYALPNQNATLQQQPSGQAADRIAVPVTGGGGKQFEFETHSATANKYLRSLARGGPRLPPPGKVFCSRELENGLVEHVAERTAPVGLGDFPSDDDLRSAARDILGTQATAADDPVLLGKFKDMVREKLRLGLGAPTTAAASTALSAVQTNQSSQHLSAPPSSTDAFGEMPLEIDLNLTESQMTDILQDMDLQFGDATGLNNTIPEADFGL